jgi:hypothetical protein
MKNNKSRLYVLEKLGELFLSQNISLLKDTIFICTQHLLDTSLCLFSKLIELGAVPNNIFLIGKCYSTCPAIAEKLVKLGIQLQKTTLPKFHGEYKINFHQDLGHMLDNVMARIHNDKKYKAVVILDDGGRCFELISKNNIPITIPVVGIEQTTAGIWNFSLQENNIPFINVAACAAKKHLECKIITQEILAKLDHLIKKDSKASFGIVGVGIIGECIVQELLERGYNVFVYDEKVKKTGNKILNNARWCDNLGQLISNADYILGCTGRDITKEEAILESIKTNKIFISCSSEDKEFFTFLKTLKWEENGCLDDLHCSLPNGAVITILNGGFPVNFDRNSEIASANDIQLTRGLLLGAIMQAVIMIPEIKNKEIKGKIMLDPIIQKFIVQYWSNREIPIANEIIHKFIDKTWIESNSGGNYYPLSYYFQKLKENNRK